MPYNGHPGKEISSFTEKNLRFVTLVTILSNPQKFSGFLSMCMKKEKVKNRPMLGKSITDLLITAECKTTANA